MKDLGCETDRIGNIKNLTTRLVADDRWDMVFNIAEWLRGFGRELTVGILGTGCLANAWVQGCGAG